MPDVEVAELPQPAQPKPVVYATDEATVRGLIASLRREAECEDNESPEPDDYCPTRGGDFSRKVANTMQAMLERLSALPPPDAEKQVADELFAAIAHGDEQHRQWLRDQVDAFYADRSDTVTALRLALSQSQKEAAGLRKFLTDLHQTWDAARIDPAIEAAGHGSAYLENQQTGDSPSAPVPRAATHPDLLRLQDECAAWENRAKIARFGEASKQTELDGARQSAKALRTVLQTLVTKLDLIDEHPAFKGILVFLHVHNCPYTGPTYEHELNAAREALGVLGAAAQAPSLDASNQNAVEHAYLLQLWGDGKATHEQMDRCMELARELERAAATQGDGQ